MSEKDDTQLEIEVSAEDKTIKAGIKGDQNAINKFFIIQRMLGHL